MKKWYYIHVYNPLYVWLNRNKKHSWYCGNFEFKLWYSETPMPLKDLMITRYTKLGKKHEK